MALKGMKVFLIAGRSGREDIIHNLEASGCTVIQGRSFTDSKYYTEDQLVAMVPEMDALMISTGEIITRRVLEAAVHLKVISKSGRGVEGIDVSAATELGIMVTNTATELNTHSTAEYAVAMLLAAAKHLKLGDQNARKGNWRSVQPVLLKNKTVGIVGLGRIGSRVASFLRPFGVRLLAYDPYVTPEKAKEIGVEMATLEILLRVSDFVTLHAVQTQESKGLIGEAQLAMMKPDAYIINTSRGGLIDEAALAKCLKEKRIAGAALDVFEPEIPGPENALLDEDIYFNTLYSPHVAGLNQENNWEIPIIQMENCLTALRGDIPLYVVNPDVIPEWRERFHK